MYDDDECWLSRFCFKVSSSCATNNGGCSHFCVVKTSGGHECVCQVGLSLKADGKTCNKSKTAALTTEEIHSVFSPFYIRAKYLSNTPQSL